MTDLSPAEIIVISALRKAAKTAPDLCAVEALQDFAGLYLKVEPLLTQDMKATLFGIGALLAGQADKEMAAMVQAMAAIGKAQGK